MQIVIHPVWWVNDAPEWQEKLRQSCRRSMNRYSAGIEEVIDCYQTCLRERAERDKLFQLYNPSD